MEVKRAGNESSTTSWLWMLVAFIVSVCCLFAPGEEAWGVVGQAQGPSIPTLTPTRRALPSPTLGLTPSPAPGETALPSPAPGEAAPPPTPYPTAILPAPVEFPAFAATVAAQEAPLSTPAAEFAAPATPRAPAGVESPSMPSTPDAPEAETMPSVSLPRLRLGTAGMLDLAACGGGLALLAAGVFLTRKRRGG